MKFKENALIGAQQKAVDSILVSRDITKSSIWFGVALLGKNPRVIRGIKKKYVAAAWKIGFELDQILAQWEEYQVNGRARKERRMKYMSENEPMQVGTFYNPNLDRYFSVVFCPRLKIFLKSCVAISHTKNWSNNVLNASFFPSHEKACQAARKFFVNVQEID